MEVRLREMIDDKTLSLLPSFSKPPSRYPTKPIAILPPTRQPLPHLFPHRYALLPHPRPPHPKIGGPGTIRAIEGMWDHGTTNSGKPSSGGMLSGEERVEHRPKRLGNDLSTTTRPRSKPSLKISSSLWMCSVYQLYY